MKEKKTPRGSWIFSNDDGLEVYCSKVSSGRRLYHNRFRYVVWKPKHMVHEEYNSLRPALRAARAAMERADRKIL